MADAYSYIRFSTVEQAKGDSHRRQQEQIDAFVKENNLTLRDSAAFSDLGVSGFRGSNLSKGLGRFIAEVDAKKVARGSYLIVESLDRLSRQNVMDSLGLLISLIEKGIRVVALNDAGTKVLDKNADFPALVFTLGTMFRAHDESAKKSMRLKSVWRQKKQNAKSKPVSVRCPEWLAYNQNTGKFDPIPERVKTIHRIYELSDQGIGRHRIIRLLNREGTKSFRNEANGWQGSSMAKLLRNRALIGYYQPASVEYDPETGKERRVPDGEEVSGYYPRVIDDALLRRVANRRHTRAVPLVGRQGPSLSNLFVGMIFCGYCEAPMIMCNKGPLPKGRRYLVCSKAVRGKGCRYRSWAYDHIEPLILIRLRVIDFAQIIGATSTQQELVDIRDRKATISEQMQLHKRTLSNLEDSLSQNEGKIPKGLVDRWNKEEEAVDVLTQEFEELSVREIDTASRQQNPAQFGEQLVRLYDAMDNATEEDRYLLRVRLRERLGLAIDRIEVKPLANDEISASRLAMKGLDALEIEELSDHAGPAPLHRTVVVKFKNGTETLILPVGKDRSTAMDLTPRKKAPKRSGS